jgi:predicted Zn-dependent protease
MKKSEPDPALKAAFDEAIRLRDRGDLQGAIAILRRLSGEKPNLPSILGTLAGLEFQAGDLASAVDHGFEVVRLSPGSELASLTLFHALHKLGRASEAFAEVARFRSRKHSDEFDRLLAEMHDGIQTELKTRPLDPALLESLALVLAETKARPIRQ